MKKLLVTFLVLVMLIVPILALGQQVPVTAPTVTIEETVTRVINIIWFIIITIVALLIMLAAFNFLMAAGDPEGLTRAKNFLLYAVVGLVVGFAARGIGALLVGQFR